MVTWELRLATSLKGTVNSLSGNTGSQKISLLHRRLWEPGICQNTHRSQLSRWEIRRGAMQKTRHCQEIQFYYKEAKGKYKANIWEPEKCIASLLPFFFFWSKKLRDKNLHEVLQTLFWKNNWWPSVSRHVLYKIQKSPHASTSMVHYSHRKSWDSGIMKRYWFG